MNSYGEDRYYQVPEDPTDERIYTCEKCGCGIYEDETYYDLDGIVWCEECIKNRAHLA